MKYAEKQQVQEFLTIVACQDLQRSRPFDPILMLASPVQSIASLKFMARKREKYGVFSKYATAR